MHSERDHILLLRHPRQELACGLPSKEPLTPPIEWRRCPESRTRFGISKKDAPAVLGVCITDGSRVISRSHNGRLLEWELEGATCVRAFAGRVLGQGNIAMTPDGARIVCGNSDGVMQQWDVGAGKELWHYMTHEERFEGLLGHFLGGAVIHSGFGRKGCYLGHEDPRYSKHCASPINSICVSPDGRIAASGGDHGTIRGWDLTNGKCIDGLESGTSSIRCMSSTPDGSLMVAGRDNGAVELWNIRGGGAPATLSGEAGGSGSIESVCVTPDGRRAVLGCGDATLRVYDLRNGKCLVVLRGDAAMVAGLAVTPDGGWVLSGSLDGTVRVWDIQNGECVAICREEAGITCVAVAGASRFLACGTIDSRVLFYYPRNLPMAPQIVTPTRLWVHNPAPSTSSDLLIRQQGRWAEDITAGCPWCSKRFAVPREIIDTINSIFPGADLPHGQSPCLNLPNEAWNEPTLLSACPLCQRPLRYNPFIWDNQRTT